MIEADDKKITVRNSQCQAEIIKVIRLKIKLYTLLISTFPDL